MAFQGDLLLYISFGLISTIVCPQVLCGGITFFCTFRSNVTISKGVALLSYLFFALASLRFGSIHMSVSDDTVALTILFFS